MLKKWMLLVVILIGIPFATSHANSKWWTSAVFYQIFPLSYYDSDDSRKGDIKGITQKLDYLEYLGVTAIWLTPIHPVPKGSYHGYAVNDYYSVRPDMGTLENYNKLRKEARKGDKADLDKLVKEAQEQGMKDYEELIKEAHKRGIKVVMDLVINHTSTKHSWFIDAALKEDSKYKDYYIWKKTDPGWPNASGNSRQPGWQKYEGDGVHSGHVFYAAFNFTLPDLNIKSDIVQKEIEKIAKFWIDKGVDGFRLDAVRYCIETGSGKGQIDTEPTIEYLQTFSKYVKSVNPDVYVIGEVFAGHNICKTYYKGFPGMDAVFDFEIGGKGGVIQGAFQTGRTSAFYKVMNRFLAIGKTGIPLTFFSPFFSNHDSGRMPETLRTPEKIKAAAAVFFTMPGGAPYIYYGDEIGQREGVEKIGDAQMRNPMYWDSSKWAGFTKAKGPWTRGMKSYYMDPSKADDKNKKKAVNCNVATQKNDPQSVLQMFRKMIAMRKKYKALQTGEYSEIKIDLEKIKIHSKKKSTKKPKNPFITYIRSDSETAIMVFVNPGKKVVEIKQDLNNEVLNNGEWEMVESIYSEDLSKPLPKKIKKDILNNKFNLKMEPRGFIVMVLKKK